MIPMVVPLHEFGFNRNQSDVEDVIKSPFSKVVPLCNGNTARKYQDTNLDNLSEKG